MGNNWRFARRWGKGEVVEQCDHNGILRMSAQDWDIGWNGKRIWGLRLEKILSFVDIARSVYISSLNPYKTHLNFKDLK